MCFSWPDFENHEESARKFKVKVFATCRRKWGEDFKKYNAFTTLQAFEALNNRSNFVKSL